jgi:hypothetical protein
LNDWRWFAFVVTAVVVTLLALIVLWDRGQWRRDR